MAIRKKLIVGTRSSALALIQTNYAIELIRMANPDTDVEVRTIKTKGDISQNPSFLSMGKGVFVKEIEDALFNSEIDLAVHSLKDLLTEMPLGMKLGAVSQREDPRDVLIDRWRLPLDKLPSEARIGTSSPRRAAFLKALRSDVEILPMRGNVDTRLKKASGEDYDGTIMAVAGMIRMGRQGEVSQYLSPEEFVPAVGQGALAVEIRDKDKEVLAIVQKIDDAATRTAVTAERSFLAALGGGCAVPVAAFGRIENNVLRLVAAAASEDGEQIFRSSLDSNLASPEKAGQKLAKALLKAGASRIL